MSEHTRPYTAADVAVMPAGDDYVVITMYATKKQAADLVWQLTRKVTHPGTYPAGSVQGQYREFYNRIRTEVAAMPGVGRLLDPYPEA